MKFRSVLVFVAGSVVSSSVSCGEVVVVSLATTDMANSVTRGGGSGGSRLRAVSTAGVGSTGAGYSHQQQQQQHSVGVSSAVIGKADNMYMDNSNMLMMQGEQLKREMRRQTNDQLSRILLQTSDKSQSGTGGEANEQDGNEEMVVLYMGGLKEISDRVRRLFGSREESSAGVEAGSSRTSGPAGGLRNWF
jgi:hypothetical protein